MRSLATLIAILANFFSFAYCTTASLPAEAQGVKMPAPFIIDPHTDNTVLVRGWSQAELNRILTDFLKQYGLANGTLRTKQSVDGAYTIGLPNDFDPKFVLFLVNYLQYPRGFDLKRHSIGAVAHVVLTAAYGVPDRILLGKRARIYVPANDAEYDLVYLQTESGTIYRIPFTNLNWEKTGDARIPVALEGR